jgi:hypothetical protein
MLSSSGPRKINNGSRDEISKKYKRKNEKREKRK